jgi:hypothetical protein
VLDLEGRTVDPLQAGTNKTVVLLFISNDCPISNRYAPELRRLHAEYSPRSVKFWLVHPNADESVAAIRQHARDYQLPTDILRDSEHALVKLAQAKVTPEAAVFLPDRRLVYHGRIDNWWADFGKARPQPTKRDLRDVLEAVLAGKPVPKDHALAVGCTIAAPR